MMLIFLCVLVQMSTMEASPFLAHSKAVAAGGAGDHARAQQLLHAAMVQSPHDAELLYDAGVAEFKLGNHEAASHYFEKTVQLTDQSPLQEDALFNAGNAYAHQKKYDEALVSYEKILSKDPDHAQARHNYDQVKKLKEQPERYGNKKDEYQQQNHRVTIDRVKH